MNKEWGTPISKDKIISRRNKLIEWQKIGELRFTPLYEIIDENILDINYMIHEIDRLNNIIEEIENTIENFMENHTEGYIDWKYDREIYLAESNVLQKLYDTYFDKLKELKENKNEEKKGQAKCEI